MTLPVDKGSVLIDKHHLANAGSIVNVGFLQLAEVTIELLVEEPIIQVPIEVLWRPMQWLDPCQADALTHLVRIGFPTQVAMSPEPCIELNDVGHYDR